jgi:hypothetical protein
MRFIEVSSGDRIAHPRRNIRRDATTPLQSACQKCPMLIRLEFSRDKVKTLFLPVNSGDSDAVHTSH